VNHSKILVSWIGSTDLRAAGENDDKAVGLGPLAQALVSRPYDLAVLLSDFPEDRVDPYVSWLRGKVTTSVQVRRRPLSGPTELAEIYTAAVEVLTGVVEAAGPDANLTFHLSPGTPAMAAVWIILSKTRFPAELIESSREHGVRTVAVPLDISADFLPDLLRRPDEELERLSAGLPPEAPEFEEIIHRGPAMRRVIVRARRVAPRSIPVLIEGETGTGKELLARAIHRASPRKEGPFVGVNCGAIPPELVESELFGHERGAFTGATARRAGHFETATGGTVFLDEIGELPKAAQVKLLRTLQEGEVLPVGSSRPRPIDVRIISATNRSLAGEVTADRFRPDLFHRLAVAVLRLPPLRDRNEDLPLLIDHFLEQVNRESRGQPGCEEKNLSVAARNLLLRHSWPGNVRELYNTLLRAAVWTPGPTLTEEDIRDAFLEMPEAGNGEGILHRPLGEGLVLPELLARVARHYLERALDETRGNKTRAARLLGLPSYQTLTNWMKRYGVDR